MIKCNQTSSICSLRKAPMAPLPQLKTNPLSRRQVPLGTHGPAGCQAGARRQRERSGRHQAQHRHQRRLSPAPGPGLAGVGGRAPKRAPSPARPAPKRRRPGGSSSPQGGGSGERPPPPPPLPSAAAGWKAAAAGAPESAMAANNERTFIAIKPDGVQRGLVGEIIKRFEQKGFRLVAMKLVHASEDLLKQHYIDLKDRPFYPGLVKYMNSGPVVAMVWEGLNVVKTGRVMLGETNPADSKPGTIRGDFCIQVGRNIIHGSDSVESAQKEINLWFKPAELVDFKSCAHDWIYE
ncbi:nucleoside diphosphate kinase isoform X1 [Strigops habroptila]|uniref:Nucleoside diphosphate kinase n=2 Tax=Psittacidae TaxID=9224 RepID=A0A672VBZ9_STRHB|nr:nucleoside diphosphate kinase isoform X1 [Strigops habroptila]